MTIGSTTMPSSDAANRPMTREERKVIVASSAGTVFEWYDFYLAGSLAANIATAFVPGTNDTAKFIFVLFGFAAGFAVRDVPEGHLCCGSAGTYNILQPEIAARLRDRKVANIERVAPQVIATGNIGCMTQIGSGTAIPILHTVELLDWAYGGERPARLSGIAPVLEAAE